MRWLEHEKIDLYKKTVGGRSCGVYGVVRADTDWRERLGEECCD